MAQEPSTRNELFILQKELSKSILTLDIVKLMEKLCELLNQDLTSELLNATKFTKLLDYFVKSYINSKNDYLAELAELVKIASMKLKSIRIDNGLHGYEQGSDRVRDPKLREKIRNRVEEILCSNGFGVKEAESLALLIENKIRVRDPNMGKKYINQTKKMIKDIKALDKLSYMLLERSN